MIRSITLAILMTFSTLALGQPLATPQAETTSENSANRNWNIQYLEAKQVSISRALNMLETRYMGTKHFGEKLYISGLMYKLMGEQGQPFYSGNSGDPEFQKLEDKFIKALRNDGTGQYLEAQQGFLTLLSEMQAQSDTTGKLLLKYQLCRSLNEQAQYHQANYYCSALENSLMTMADPVIPLFQAYRVIANNQYFRSDFTAALNSYMRVIEHFPQGHDISGIYNDLGNLLKDLEQFEKSAQYLKEALAKRADGSDLMKAQVHHSLADLYMVEHKIDLAISHFLQAESLLRSSNHVYGGVVVELGLGRAYTATEQYNLAHSHLVNALSGAQELNNNAIRINAYLAISDMFESQALLAESKNYAQLALDLAEGIQRHKYIAAALLQLSRIAEKEDNYQQTFLYYQRYTEIQLKARDIDNRLAFEALEKAHSEYEKELDNSVLLNRTRLDKLKIEKMQQERLMYNALLGLLMIAATLTILANRKISHKAALDAMTKAFSRAEIIRRIKLVKQSQDPYQQHVLILLDLDMFKSINDKYGHPTGDRALIHVSRQVRRLLNKGELFGRLGGEEFLIYLKEVDAHEVRERVEDLHYAISNTHFLSESKKPLQVTASFAYLATSKPLSDFDILYSVLDQALYQAKSNGRNCIIDAYNEPIDLPESNQSQIVYEPAQS